MWIDVVSYNQHRVESIAADMKAVVASIGRLGIPIINSVPFYPSLVSVGVAVRSCGQAQVEVYEANGSAYDLGFLSRGFLEEFKSVERAATTLPEDREQILAAMTATFGSISATDEHIRGLISTMLSTDSDKPWNRK